MANFPFVHQVTRTPIQCKCSVKSSNYLTLKKKMHPVQDQMVAPSS